MNDHPVYVVVIEWRPSKGKVSVRGCWSSNQFISGQVKLLEPDNKQNEVEVFEGFEMKSPVGFQGLRES